MDLSREDPLSSSMLRMARSSFEAAYADALDHVVLRSLFTQSSPSVARYATSSMLLDRTLG